MLRVPQLFIFFRGWMAKGKRIVALIDGYNFYHPIKHHQNRLKHCLKWLNYRELLAYYVDQTPKLRQGELGSVYYFTAKAYHRDTTHPGTTDRHQVYINALRNVDVHIEMGNFKRKPNKFSCECPNRSQNIKQSCHISQLRHEEKETDVRVACKLLELAALDAFDTCLLLSADSDMVPAIETLLRLYPNKEVVLVTPPSKAKIDKLIRLSSHHIKVSVNNLKRFQFPNMIQLPNGYKLQNPWAIR